MAWPFVSSVLVLDAAVAAVLAALVWRRRSAPGATYFALLLLAAGEWALLSGLEKAVLGLPAKVTCAKLEYLGIASIAPLWLLFALAYTRQDDRLQRGWRWGLWVIPLATVLLAWTNEAHGLIWSRVYPVPGSGNALLTFEHGPAFFVAAAYNYLLLLGGTGTLIWAVVRGPRLLQQQALALLGGAAVPWASNGLYLAGVGLPAGIDPTPLAFTATGAIYFWALYRYRLLDVVPIARAAVVEGLPDSVIVLDREGRVVDANPAAQRLLGRSSRQLAGQPIRAVWPAPGQPLRLDELAAHQQFDLKLLQGEAVRLYHVDVVPLAAGGRAAGTIITLHDMTRRQQVAEALRESQERFRQAFEFAATGMALVDLDGRWRQVNRALCQLVGYSPPELLARDFQSLTHPDDLDADLSHVRQLLAGETQSYQMEKRYFHKQGHIIWVLLSVSLVRDADGLPMYFIAQIQDVMEKKQVLEVVQQSAQRYQALYETADRQARELALFSSLAQRLNAVTTPKEAGRIILLVADQLLGWDASFVELYAPAQDELRALLNFDLVDGERAEVAPATAVRQPGTIARRVITEGGQLMLRSAETAATTGMTPFGDQSRRSLSLMFVPIRHGPSIAGILSIQKYTPEAYSAESLATLQALADHAGGALDRIGVQAELQQSEARQRHLVEHSNDLIYETDASGYITSFNPTAVRLLGYAAEHLRGRHYLDFVHPDYRRQVAHFYGQQFAARIANTYDEVLVLTREGAPIWLGQNVQLVLDGGEVVGSQVVARDVTRRRQAEQALTETNQKLTIWVSELEQRNREISMLSHMGELLQACQTVGEAYDVFSQTLMHLFPADAGAMYLLNASRDRLEAAMMWGEQAAFAPAFAPDDCWALRRGQTHMVDGASAALRCRHLGDGPGGPAMCVPMTAQAEALGLLHLRPALAANGATREAQARQMEATQRLATTVVDQMALALSNLRLRETLRGQAIRDPLTGLFNRRYLEETLERELNRAERSQRPFGVIMLDLDHFKRFNDTFGHAAGDAVLRELGRFLEDQTRGGDIACRYGGEEFTLILPECPLDSTLRRAEQFREGVKRLEVQHRGQLLGAITISLGVANYPDHGRTGDVLLQRADAALYRAKREGRDRVIAATAR